MAVSENLFNVTQNYFSPDIIQKFSNEIQQPIEKTKATLKTIIPTVLMGIVSKGSTQEGAESLVNLANKHSSIPSPENINPNQGNEVVNDVFGSNVNNIVAKLGTSTGLNSGSITKFLGMVTPMIMGVLGSKIKNEKLNAYGLMHLLQQQKSVIAGMIPSSIGGLSSATSGAHSVTGTKHYQVTKKSSWGKIGLIAAASIALLWWFNARKTLVNVIPTPSTVATTATIPEVTQPLSGLSEFMSMTSGGMIKRFGFERLNFDSGTATLIAGSEIELNQIADTMKNYPASTIRIEGFTDNVGEPAINHPLSLNRAQEVKNQLIARGIDSSRIQTAGLGSASPISMNDTLEGRTINRRIELIVKRQ